MVKQNHTLTDESIRNRLTAILAELRLVHSGVVIAASALRYHNSERDNDAASVLDYCVAGRLFDQLDRTAELIALLEPDPQMIVDKLMEDIREYELFNPI